MRSWDIIVLCTCVLCASGKFMFAFTQQSFNSYLYFNEIGQVPNLPGAYITHVPHLQIFIWIY